MRQSAVAPVVFVSMLAAAVPALAQHPGEPSATVEQAVARAIVDAMPDLRYPWALDWTAFGLRGGRDVFWHLAPPVPYHREPPPPGVTWRTGWLTVRGRTGDVRVCGDADRVGALHIGMSDIWLGEGDLIQELEARGVRVVPTARRDAIALSAADGGSDHYNALLTRRPALQTWRLERPGHEAVDLAAAWRCTPPGTRSATRCGTEWTIVFRPDGRAEPCLPPAAPT